EWSNLPEAKTIPGYADLGQIFRAVAGIQPDVAASAGPAITPPPFSTIFGFLRGRALLQRGDVRGARETWMYLLAAEPNRDMRVMLFAVVGATYWREGDEAKGTQYFLDAANALELQIDDIHVEELLSSYLGSYHHFFFDLV